MKLSRRDFLKTSAFAGCAALVASYPIFIERSIVQVNTYRIPVPRLPSLFEGFTIVQLTDLHYGPLSSFEQTQAMMAQVNSMPRDLIVCTGDYIHKRFPARHIDVIWPLLATLQAPSGVFSVLGNHDHLRDTARSIYWLDKTGQNLRHRIRKIDRSGQALWFAGAGDFCEDHRSIDALMKPIPPDDCRIVLAHNPDSADTIAESPADLIVAGHTHGGQVDIPFNGPPVVSTKNQNYTSGLKRSQRGAPVFISRGIGWTVLPVRFNCYPEIAVLVLTNA
jgi:predicted MPP superfamily phosphohydrolase